MLPGEATRFRHAVAVAAGDRGDVGTELLADQGRVVLANHRPAAETPEVVA